MIRSDDFTVRVGVGTLEGLHSSIFRFWSNPGQSDVYLGVRDFASEIKVSLHESGECNAGLTDQFAEQEKSAVAAIGGSRHHSQWRRLKHVGKKVVVPLQCAIPSSELRIFEIKKVGVSKKIIWLEPPKQDRSIIISCAFSGQSLSDDAWPGKKNGTSLLGIKDLPNKEKFWLFYQECPTDKIEYQIIAEAEEHMQKQKMVRFTKTISESGSVGRRLIFREFFNHQMLIMLDKAVD